VPLELITRRGCHLCEEAERALQELGVTFELRDVDGDPDLFERYDFRVPVLLRDGRPLAEGRLDRAALVRGLLR
jgi:glutaredoxin